MNDKLETPSDDGLNLGVYLALLFLTGATLTAGVLHEGGRIMVVSIALIIAAVKASLIGFYYMGLRRERALTFMIIGAGLIATAILMAGILPDMTWARF